MAKQQKNVRLSEQELKALDSLRQSLELKTGLQVSEARAVGYAIVKQDEIEKRNRPAQARGIKP